MIFKSVSIVAFDVVSCHRISMLCRYLFLFECFLVFCIENGVLMEWQFWMKNIFNLLAIKQAVDSSHCWIRTQTGTFPSNHLDMSHHQIEAAFCPLPELSSLGSVFAFRSTNPCESSWTPSWSACRCTITCHFSYATVSEEDPETIERCFCKRVASNCVQKEGDPLQLQCILPADVLIQPAFRDLTSQSKTVLEGQSTFPVRSLS